MRAQLYGLVLAGGHSRRMQRDKASLDYGGRPQLLRAMQLLEPLVARSFVSVRPDQLHDAHRAAYDRIADLLPELGPLAGIHAALRAHADTAWLVLACDLPLLDAATLQHLIARRAPARLATAYRSSFDGRPEPLCAIFEPASREPIEAWIGQGQRCPRALLSQMDVELLDLPDARALDNVNTLEEYAAAKTAVGAPPAVRRHVAVQYFAALREQAGCRVETIETQARTPQELYEELRRRHGLTLAPQSVRVAVNDEFSDWRQPLADGDTVVFLPPVAGG